MSPDPKEKKGTEFIWNGGEPLQKVLDVALVGTHVGICSFDHALMLEFIHLVMQRGKPST